VKRLNANKASPVADRFVLAGSGSVAQIEELVRRVDSAISDREAPQRTQPTDDGCDATLYDTLLALPKYDNVDRSNVLGLGQGDPFFNPLSASAGFFRDGGVAARILCPDAFVEPIRDHATAGSGAVHAGTLTRILHEPEIHLAGGVLLAAHVIREVKEIEPNCGGPTKIVPVSRGRIAILRPDRVSKRKERWVG
jgi:hypothetical protein